VPTIIVGPGVDTVPLALTWLAGLATTVAKEGTSALLTG